MSTYQRSDLELLRSTSIANTVINGAIKRVTANPFTTGYKYILPNKLHPKELTNISNVLAAKFPNSDITVNSSNAIVVWK